ncbi:TPA: WYL domain-containing protein [Vibrio parahaemolyticus]|uniref:WYL domain-containing protein n=4 Tax=Vibrio parahaemolyticus TaxID=670 RepID=UPI0004488EF4|nr:WYL domain-containing protein [Vibrio parahaemolyticus]EJG0871133.1 WYL domain-containing protein [Vibrio parahaemolyticus O3]EJG0899792.1 WYL domain-containing protein [Vibrio parahaemolyticus O3:K56]EJG1072614.1 WYL domain-containing protein [Vibrio parahaemolyticus O1:K56]EGQ8940445.1 WYL domain-containing protein [Vibrio parahaemolyticus]EGQ8948544.1 WYL domain-containing protein [Vibrio parahaemolyticus]
MDVEGKNTEATNEINERLAYVDFKLFFTGKVSRADLKGAFGIAEAAASRVLTEYSKLRPNNKTQKTNTIIRESFDSLIDIDAELALGMLANGFNSNKLFGVTELSYEKIGKIPNRLNLGEVAMITRAISGKYSIFCQYLSNNSVKHDRRNLVPLAIMYDGTSWMFRAFDRSEKNENKFKNFHFSRIRNVVEDIDSKTAKQKENEALSQDKHWNLRLPLILKLHTSLPEKERQKVRTDFGIPDDKDEIYVTERAAFRWILEKKWHIDARTHTQKEDDKQKRINRFYKFELTNLNMVMNMEGS